MSRMTSKLKTESAKQWLGQYITHRYHPMQERVRRLVRGELTTPRFVIFKVHKTSKLGHRLFVTPFGYQGGGEVILFTKRCRAATPEEIAATVAARLEGLVLLITKKGELIKWDDKAASISAMEHSTYSTGGR